MTDVIDTIVLEDRRIREKLVEIILQTLEEKPRIRSMIGEHLLYCLETTKINFVVSIELGDLIKILKKLLEVSEG